MRKEAPAAAAAEEEEEEEEGEDGPERNSGVFPQETEPEAGCGGAGEPQHSQA